ncbi:MAG: lipopolysaccharide biosynthesis protein [Candidatus Thorarchaeota archaeon]|jgi:O-antigen/teichoic acid export membrane protein
MTEAEKPITRDRYTLNVVAESISRILSFVGGLISTVILWRSISASLWTTDEYGIIKVLTNANQALMPFILLGINGAVVRVVAGYSSDREKLGKTVGSAISIITLAYVMTSLITVFFGLDQVLLYSAIDIGYEIESLRIYWLIVLVTLLPTAYMRITKAAFSGIQQMKRSMYIDIIYSTVRIVGLVSFFAFRLVNILNIMLLNLGIALLASTLALTQLVVEMRKHQIPWGFGLDQEVMQRVGRLALVSLAGSLSMANMNNVTILWMNTYGTLENVGWFSIAQGITLTARMVIAAPMAALAPNLTEAFELKKQDDLERKFHDATRMSILTYSFVFAGLFAYATPILRILYGADSTPASVFLQLLAFNVIFVVIPGIYSSLFLAVDDAGALLWTNILQVIFQTAWVVLATPIIGVIAIAMIWIAYLPYFALVQYYSGRRHGIQFNRSVLVGGLSLGIVFALFMHLGVLFIKPIIDALPIWDIFGAAFICLLVIPAWFVYIGVATAVGLLRSTDLQNLEDILRVIPLTWWITRPLVTRIGRMAERREAKKEI